MERKLASVQKIVNIEPIPNADAIEKATVLGWEIVVAKKDNFKIGDLVCYFEIDSIVPECPEFEFLRERKFRVRTIRLRKQISQGLVIPLSFAQNKTNKTLYEGDDVTSLLGVKKYDPQGDQEEKERQVQTSNEKNKVKKFFMQYSFSRRIIDFLFPKERYVFPAWIKKTDEDRIQLFPDICEKQKGVEFIATEKVDGQSLTVFVIKNPRKFLWFGEDYIFGVCSRNFRLKENNSSWWTVAKKYNMKENIIRLMKELGIEKYVIQGEIIGPGIQGNKYALNDYKLYVFNIVSDGKNLDYYLQNSHCDVLDLETVPLVYQSFFLKPTIQENVELAKGKSVLHNTLREGIVVRNYEKNLSFKIINSEFLLKNEE